MNRPFIDTDIVLDLLLARAPHFNPAARLFSLIESGKVRGHVSALTFANLHYVLRRALSGPETVRHLRKLRLLLHVAPLTDRVVDQALASEFKDFEDALQNYTVSENGLNCLITRNKRDYKNAAVPVYTAEEYLNAPPS